jgi:Homeodomain-like domain/DDE superfamily endonuclease
MAQTSSILLNAGDRERLAALVADRNRPHKHVQRARIILCSDERLPVLQIAKRVGVSRPAVWRWQQRFAEEGLEGLLRDKTRPPGKAPVPPETVAQVLAITCSEPPGEVTHWTGRAVAKKVGLALRTIQRIWQAHRVQPHRVRTFKRSNDPAFAEKVEDIVGLYMSPPAHAVVLSIDEKSQIQALSRTRPGAPVRPGRPATMTHDYKRHGTTTLFAALNVLDGTVLGRCMQRHRHQEFIRFLNAVEAAVPAGKVVHAIMDNYAVHKQPEGARLALAPSALGVPFHADLGLVAERRRGLLLGAHATPAEARRLHLARRPPGRDQALHRRAQRRSAPLRLDEARQGNPRQNQPPRCTTRMSQCTSCHSCG